MNHPAYRIVTIAALALLAGAFIIAAVLALKPGDGNAPIQIISPNATPTAETKAASTQIGGVSAPIPTPTEADLQVYISGAVQNPGVYPLKPGDRLVDALTAAGGATSDADLNSINLAQRVRDEAHYYVPIEGETPPPIAEMPAGESNPLPEATAAGSAAPNDGLINLNTASADALTSLPSIGTVKAQAIVSYREQNGPFASVEEITQVSGIGPATYENIRDLVTVGAP